MLLQTNRVYTVSESAFSSFFASPMGVAVADRVLQSFKPTGC